MTIALTPYIAELLDNALADETPCLVATATSGGDPQISPKGSVAVYDQQTLCFWDRSGRSSLARLRENPHVVIYYRNTARVKNPANGALRFHGRARVATDPETRENVWEKTIAAERKRDPDKAGAAILVAVERIEDLYGKPILAGQNLAGEPDAGVALAAYRSLQERVPAAMRDGHHRRVAYLISSLPAALPEPLEAGRRELLRRFDAYCADGAAADDPGRAAQWKAILVEIDALLERAAR